MDIERRRRMELIERLGPSFVCGQEVRLIHAMFPRVTVRADVLAFAVDGDFAGIPLAFEVKEPAPDQQSKHWIGAMRQAADYVYARIDDRPLGPLQRLVGRRVSAAFIYPSPVISDFGLDDGTDPLLGVVTMALHFRVGQLRPTRGRPGSYALAFANNEIWRSDKGFTKTAAQFLDGRYRLGSRSINAMVELDDAATE